MLITIFVFSLCTQMYSATLVKDESMQSKYNDITDINRYEPSEPDECVNEPYCHIKCENYPDALIEEHILRHNFNNYPVDINRLEQRSISEIGVGQANAVEKYNYLCKEKTKAQVIFQARNINGKNRFILQGTTFQQILITRQCVNPLGSCSSVAKFPDYIEAKCVQVIATRSFLIMTSNSTIQSDEFPVPVSCQCRWGLKENF